jgi:DNA-binding MarR family transcriptional regulator
MACKKSSVSDFELNDFMPYQLAVAASRISALFALTYSREFGITIAEWRVIAHVGGRATKMSANVVAVEANLDKVKVSRAVAALVAQGLLRQERDAGDRRAYRLALTAAGRRVYHAVVARGTTIERIVRDELGAHDHAELQRLLLKLREALDRGDVEERLEAAGLSASRKSASSAEARKNGVP